MRLLLSRRLILVFSLVMLLGCGKSEQAGNVRTVTFWHSFVSSTEPALKELIRRFEAEHPEIRINAQYIPTGDALIQKLVASVQSGTAPDVSWVHSDFLGRLVQADAIYPMSHFVNGPDGLSQQEMDDIFPALLEGAQWGDTLYAMPMEGTLLALVYNKRMFQEVGLDPNRPPQTWDELREYTRKLTRDKDGDGRNEQVGFYVPVYPASGPLNLWMVLQWSPYLWQAGGIEINEAQTQVLYNSDAGVRALSFWRDLHADAGYFVTTNTHDVSFASQYAAMIMDGPWDLPRFRELTHIDWAVAPLPRGPEEQVTYLAGEHLAIFKQSKLPEEAWTFVKWMLRPETQAYFSMESGYLPVRKSTLDLPEYKAYLEKDAGLRAFVEQMPLGQARPEMDHHRVEINQHIAEAIERTIVGKVDPKVALDESAARSNQLLQSSAR